VPGVGGLAGQRLLERRRGTEEQFLERKNRGEVRTEEVVNARDAIVTDAHLARGVSAIDSCAGARCDAVSERVSFQAATSGLTDSKTILPEWERCVSS
jgi:hypothetical protein